jgi:cytochrome b
MTSTIRGKPNYCNLKSQGKYARHTHDAPMDLTVTLAMWIGMSANVRGGSLSKTESALQ